MFGLLLQLEDQRTEFKYEDSLPIATGHTLCCFYSTYIKEPDGSVRCTVTNKQKDEGVSCCCDMTQADQLEVIKKDRDYVLNKWDVKVPEETCCCCCDQPQVGSSEEITDIDEFLSYYRRNTFTVTGMAFQDITNLDAERLKRCRVVQLTDDNRLVPFCAYNTIYR